MGQRLYVGNLPYSMGEQELQDLFGQHGQVESVSVMRDNATGRPRGFAFVEMSSDEGAKAAIAHLHEAAVGGRTLTVNEARPREARSGGFGGGGSSRGGDSRGGHRGGGGRREPRW